VHHRPRYQTDIFAPAFALVLAVVLGLVWAWGEPPPADQHDICAMFTQRPGWYDDARAAAEHWDIAIPTLMAFVQIESAFRREARPPREYLLGSIPWQRPSSAFGYGQISDPAWSDYLAARPALSRSREDMGDVLDFIGWYNRGSVERLDIAPDDVKHLYLAYHEGRAGYRGGRWRNAHTVVRHAERVAARARAYAAQLAACEARFACDGWLEFGPLCRPRR